MDTSFYTNFVGIDIAKAKFDVATRLQNGKFKHKVFANDKQGFDLFYQWVKQFDGKSYFLLEATNIYHFKLADFLYEKGVALSVINPQKTPHFAKIANLRSKTDKVDAKALADFAYCRHDRLRLYRPKPENERKLLNMMRQLEHLKTQKAQETVRLSMLMDADCIQLSLQVIDFLSIKIKEFEKEIDLFVQNDEQLKHRFKLLTSIPAVGKIMAYWFIAHLGDGSDFKNNKEAATFFGLTPMLRQSGSSVYAVCGISKIGHSDIRKALYSPAMNFACGRFKHKEYAPFVNRLFAKGKPPKVVIVALMRKIVTIAFSVLKNQTPFDATKLGFQAA